MKDSLASVASQQFSIINETHNVPCGFSVSWERDLHCMKLSFTAFLFSLITFATLLWLLIFKKTLQPLVSNQEANCVHLHIYLFFQLLIMNANKLLLLFYKNTYNAHSLPCAYRTQCTGSKVWYPPKTEKKSNFLSSGHGYMYMH